MYKHILLPTDGSKLSDKAVKQGIEFAKALKAKVTCLFVTQGYRIVMEDGYILPSHRLIESRYNDECTQRAAQVLGPSGKLAAKAGVACDIVHVSSDVPYETIIKTAQRRKCDLIMMASHGRRGLKGLLLGSETNKVLTHSKIPVLVVR